MGILLRLFALLGILARPLQIWLGLVQCLEGVMHIIPGPRGKGGRQ